MVSEYINILSQGGPLTVTDESLNEVANSGTTDGDVYGATYVDPNNNYYYASGTEEVTKLDSNLNFQWETSDAAYDYVNDIISDGNGNIYMASDRTASIDDTDGSVNWTAFPVGTPNSLTYDSRNDRIIVAGAEGSRDHDIAALDPTDGSVIWGYSETNGEKIDSVVAVDNPAQSRMEFCFVKSDTDTAHRAYIDTGGTFQYQENLSGISAHGTNDFFSSGRIDNDGNYYFAAYSSIAYKIDTSDMSVVWTGGPGGNTTRGNEISPHPNGDAYFSIRNDQFYRLDGTDGSTTTTASFGTESQSMAYPAYEVYPDSWVTGPEQINATPVSTNASMNGTTLTLTEFLNATQISPVASMNTPTLVTTDKATATQITASATMEAPELLDTLTATPVSAVATANGAELSQFDLRATQPAVTATSLSPEVEGLVSVNATQATVSGSQNTPVTNLFIGATPVTVNTVMNTPEVFGRGTLVVSQPSVSARMNTALFIIPRGQVLGEVNSADIGNTANVSTLRNTDNSVQ